MLPSTNGLNLVRLTLVLLVILSHAFTVPRLGSSPVLLENTPGRWALAGLFAVSGYLVSSGRLRRSYPTYLMHRVMRIWPAFVLALLCIVVLFGPVGYVMQHGTIDGYLTAQHGPAEFISKNLLLEIRAYDLSGTPGTDQYGWIGNLWTIFYTVCAQAVLGLILGLRDARTRLWITVVVFVAVVIVYANVDWLMAYIQDPRVRALLRFLPFFLGGSIVYQVRERLRLTLPFGVAALAGAVMFAAIDGAWGLQAASPLLAYGLLAIGKALPAPAFLRRNDFAMGFFMYSYAVQVMLYLLGVGELVGNPWSFFVVSVIATAPFAAASWYLAERPVRDLIRRSERPRDVTVDGGVDSRFSPPGSHLG